MILLIGLIAAGIILLFWARADASIIKNILNEPKGIMERLDNLASAKGIYLFYPPCIYKKDRVINRNIGKVLICLKVIAALILFGIAIHIYFFK